MKYKYIVGLLVALSLNNAFAAEAEEPIAADDYQNIYHAFRCGGVKEINTALASNKTFNHKDDTDIIRSSQTGLALRKAVIGLNAADLQAVVENNHEFFKTSLGVSLVYGWTLNQFKEPITPYYIGYYFSFDRLFLGMASKMANAQVSTFLKRTFTLGLRAVEDDRWAFYDHMLYLPYAIEQVGIAGHSDLSIDDVIRMSRRTKEDAKAEKQALTIPMLEFDDSRDGDGDDLTLDKASYLTEIPGTYNKEQYYNDVKDLFLTDSVTAETFKKLQFFCHNTAGLDNIGIFLCSMNVDVDAKPIQLGTKVRALSNKRWFDGQTEDIITLREICAPVLEAIKGDLDFEKERAAAAEEREK
jgi:hypothetical protein